MNITLLDPLGAGLSLTATYLFTRASIKAWPVSILAIIINTILYWHKGIYGQVGLEFFYLLFSLYGWYFWSAKHQSKRPIEHIPYIWIIPLIFFALFATLGLTFLLSHFFNSDIAFWDASATILGLSAQFMMSRKWIESWILWFLVDLMVVIIHWSKGIPFHSGIRIFYLFMAVQGYLRWKHFIQYGTAQFASKSRKLRDKPPATIST